MKRPFFFFLFFLTSVGFGESPPNSSNLASWIFLTELVKAIHHPDKATALWGQCRLRNDESTNIFVPCQNVEFVLYSREGKEIAAARTDGGYFRFTVEAGQAYDLKLRSKLYRFPSEKIGRFKGGDQVSVDLKTSSTASAQ